MTDDKGLDQAVTQRAEMKRTMNPGAPQDNPRYTLDLDLPTITHHKCGKISHNPSDVLNRYCGFCNEFLEKR